MSFEELAKTYSSQHEKGGWIAESNFRKDCRLRVPLLSGCRGVMAESFLKQIGFREFHEEFVSQLRFPSEAVQGIKIDGLSC